ncbi:C6 finger domain-containing protein [Cordyceps javanica]|uniref:C6 finger domain-containing protein n=1 Tax=Cordyceps javanica TaxID=43265 RepID=A0A545UL20_9HYPO|nr:C6 finger domain-containing protein [Cordyceps javanica]TQW01654.1 C6 finger domain protein [Cordyceps javanica]
MNNHYHHSQSQQQPSPHPSAHPHFPPYPSREYFIKRERPGHATSSSHGIDGGHDSASHRSIPPQDPHAFSSESHVSYEYTSQIPHTTSPYRHDPGPSSSMQPPQAYESQSHQPMYGGMYASSSVVPVVKKKNTRASLACDSCRQLKAKCDEIRPCKTCRDRGTECKYRDPPPKVADKTQTDILDRIVKIQARITTVVECSALIEKRINIIESNINNSGPGSAAMTNTNADVEVPNKSESTPFAGEEMTKHSLQDAVEAGPDQLTTGQETLPEDKVETEPGPPPPLGEPAIPMNHTALAGLLLHWPSIQELTRHHVEREGVGYVGEYPISKEQNRDRLFVSGRGKDNRMSRKEREREQHEQQSIDVPDDSSRPPSPSTATDAADLGTKGGARPYDEVDYGFNVLGADGNPDFTETKVWSYVGTFEEHILNMHPIVQPRILHQWVRQFLDSLPVSPNKPSKITTAWASSSSMETTGSKRKRSLVYDGMENLVAASLPSKNGRLSRKINTALVLTVLALGKVCQYRKCVPDALHNGIPQSPQAALPSDSSFSQPSDLASPRDQDTTFRRPSQAGNTRSGLLKNDYGNIPGLEYFAFATAILGNHHGSYKSMKDVYANIFASLYQGQLGRPLESFAFIERAGHKLQVIMRPSLDKLRKFKTTREFIMDTGYNQLSLAFWTCLQLESDLIAELPVPPSGIWLYENDIPHPNMSLLEGFPKAVLDSYLGQLYLRTHLNCIHRIFYAPDDPKKGSLAETLFQNVGSISDAVSGMEWVPPSFAFKEDDPPASDILSARLRAKYWDAQVLTYRSFLGQVLQLSYVRKHPTTGQPPLSEFCAEVEAARIDPQARNVQDLDPHILDLARKAIKALIESTRAFHGLGDERPIITNVFGTAHAQWGNLLVLSAAFKDPIMHDCVDEKILRRLFQKTITFLRQSAAANSSLRIDMHILEGLQQDFWGIEPSYSSVGLEQQYADRNRHN